MTKSRARQNLTGPAPCSPSPSPSPSPATIGSGASNEHTRAIEFYDRSRSTLTKALEMVKQLSKEVDILSLENERLLSLLAAKDADSNSDTEKTGTRSLARVLNLDFTPAGAVCCLPEIHPPVSREEVRRGLAEKEREEQKQGQERLETFYFCDTVSECSDTSEDLEHLLMGPGSEGVGDDASSTRESQESLRNPEMSQIDLLSFDGDLGGRASAAEEEKEGVVVLKFQRNSSAQQLRRRYRAQRWKSRVVTV